MLAWFAGTYFLEWIKAPNWASWVNCLWIVVWIICGNMKVFRREFHDADRDRDRNAK